MLANIPPHFFEIWIFDLFVFFCVWKCMFVFLVCFVLQIFIFSALIGLCVVFCIYGCIFFDILTFLGKYPRSVNNLRTNYFFAFLFVILGDLWDPKWSPHPHPWRQCQSSLRGKQVWGKRFYIFYDFGFSTCNSHIYYIYRHTGKPFPLCF